MKDQYFGDFGDYQKVSLLKRLQDTTLNTSVHWMKTLDDTSTDGKHITYLDNPETWEGFDPEVFDFLKTKIATGQRHLSHIEESSFTKGITFFNEYIEDPGVRKEILHKIITSPSEIVLFDPDNGIEVASTTKRTIHKYVTWEEITTVFNSGKSVIIYQHFSRVDRHSFIQRKLEELRVRTGCSALAIQVKHSVYFFLAQPNHQDKLDEVISRFSNTWQHLGVRHPVEKGV